MTYVVTYPSLGTLGDLEDSTHLDLASAIEAVSKVVDENPQALVGYDDLAHIKDADNSELVVALFRLDGYFVLCRETIEEKYVDEIEAIGYTINNNDWDPYKVFRRWTLTPAD